MKRFCKFVFSAVLLFSFEASAQSVTRDSLDLPGCPIRDLASGTDPSSASFIIIAACESSLGLHYTRSFGGSWSTAAGGSYTAGSVSHVEVTAGGIFAIVNNAVLRTDLPASASVFTPAWAAVAGLDGASAITTLGKFLFVLRGSSISVYDTVANSLLQDFALPTGATAIGSVKAGPNYVYVLGRPSASAPKALFRTPLNATTGAVNGTWTDLSAATGLNYDSNDELINFFVNPVTSDVYLGVRRQPEFTDLMYKSTDNGQSYTSTGVAYAVNTMSFSTDGNSIVMGVNASSNGGTSWKTLSRNGGLVGDSRGRLEDYASLINPNDANQALLTTNEGVALTSNLSAASPTWTAASSGLEGTQVYVVSQSATTASKAVLGTSGGVAVTNTFTSEEVVWTYPLCPGNDCVGGRNVFIDPLNDNQIYYGSGNIRRCNITDVANVSCTDFANKPNNQLNFGVFRIYSALPTYLVAGYVRTEGATDGGLYFYNVNDASSPYSVPELAGVPIKSFVPLSVQVMFAGAGTSSLNSEALRGIYRSTNNGGNFTKMTDSDVSTTVLVNGFAYDDVRDVLYAATASQDGTSGTILRLGTALAGGTDWQKPTTTFNNKNFTDVTVDTSTGDIYASAGNEIFKSTDSGQTFSVVLTGVTGETTSDLEATTDSASSSGVSARASSKRIVQASSIGVFELESGEDPTPTPTPTATPTATATPNTNICSFQILGCKGAVRPGSACTFSVSFKNGATGKGEVNQFKITRLANGTYVNYGAASRTTKNGKRAVARKAKAGTYRVEFITNPCTTATRSIRVRR